MPRAPRPPRESGSVRPGKKGKSAAATPESADDYQELADEEEARGGKWRAGDPAKSARAFERAITFYDQGLQQYPHSFDLAYNKARLQLELAQQPALLPHWGLSEVDFLAQALESHRRALKINDDDVDLRFNMAQVLTSLAEKLTEDDRDDDAVRCLHEALESLSSCLSKQEMLLEQQSAGLEAAELDESGGVAVPPAEEEEEVKEVHLGQRTTVEESATIIQPVSPNDLLDTVQASLAALTTLAALEDEAALANLENLAQTLTETKAPSYIALLDSTLRFNAEFVVGLARATFVCALADARYTAYAIDAKSLMESIRAFIMPDLEEHADALLASAKARDDIVVSMLDRSNEGEKIPLLECWRFLTIAQEDLSQAARLQDETAKMLKAQVYELKGNIELRRVRMATLPSPEIHDQIRNNRPRLLKNAAVFYKGAIGFAGQTDEQDVLERSQQRLAVVGVLISLDEHNQPTRGPEVQQTITELVEEGLLDADIANRIASMSV